MPRKSYVAVRGTHPDDDTPEFVDPTPQDGPWYHNVRRSEMVSEEDLELRRKRAAARERAIEKIRNDPELWYKYETELAQEALARRLVKDEQVCRRMGCKQTYRSVLNTVRRNWKHTHEPLVIRRGSGADPGERKTKRTRTTFRDEIRNRKHDADEALRLNRLEEAAEEGRLARKGFDPEFIEAVKRSRVSQGLTQKQLAKRLNITENDVRHFENGELQYNGRFQGSIKFTLGLSSS